MTALGVFTTGTIVPENDQAWIVNYNANAVRDVTLSLPAFQGDKEDTYLTAADEEATVGYLKAGIPLALISSGEDAGKFGPFDPDATDGRADAVAGFLESLHEITFTRSGWKETELSAGMRYQGVLDLSHVPVEIPDGTKFLGDFYAYQSDKTVTALSGGSGAAGSAAPTITGIAVDAAGGKVTLTLSDHSTIEGTYTA
jgi:hypothetical protein